MSVINPIAKEHLQKVALTGNQLIQMFEMLLKAVENMPPDCDELSAVLRYKTDGTIIVGEVIPSIHLVLTKVTEANIDAINKLEEDSDAQNS